MGYGGMPRKKKDEFDWDNPDTLADLEKQPDNMEKTGLSEPGESKGNKKDKKGKNNKKGDDADEETPQQPDRYAEDEAEAEGKSGKKAPKARRVSFVDEADAAEASKAVEDDEDDNAAKGKNKGKGKGKGKHAGDDDDDEDTGKGKGKGKANTGSKPSAEDDDEGDTHKPKAKGNPKPVVASFAALAGDDDEDDDDEEEEEEEKHDDKKKASARGKKGKKGKKGRGDDDDDDLRPTTTNAASAKPKPKAAPKTPAASFAALMADDGGEDDDDDDDDDDEEEEKKPAKVEKKDDKKKNKDTDKAGKAPEALVPKEKELPPLSMEDTKVLKEALKKCVFKGVVVGLVKSVSKHPKANELFVLTVTDGGYTEAQVVTNNAAVAVGMKVAFAPVGSEVFDEELGVGTTKIAAIKLKNVNSAGMLCSGKLLGLNDDGDKVLELPADCPLGMDVGEAYIRLVKPEVLEAAKKAAQEARIKAEEAAAAKKAAKEAKKAQEESTTADDGAGGDDDGDKGKKKKGKAAPETKVSGKLAAIQEMQRKLREEQDRAAKLEEARKAAEEAALKAMKEEEEAEEERRRLKKEKKKEKEEQLRKEGKLLSKKQKEAQAKNEAYRKQLEAQGIVPPRPAKEGAAKDGGDADSSEDDEATPQVAGQPKRLTKNEIKQMEKERKDRLKALQEERERRQKEAEEAAAEAARRSKELADIADNWEDDAPDGGDAEGAAKGDEQQESESSEDDDGSEYDSDGQKLSKTQKRIRRDKRKAEGRRLKRMEQNLNAKSKDNLRCPVICVLGHVDTGKTKILDKIRRTNVQDGEAGGITQQIGASYFPVDAITEKTLAVKQLHNTEYNVPGLLVIDTPGHESFTNLRTRGSSLCDLAVLVVDIMHGLEPQTIESIGLLKMRRAPFIIAFNKIDRLYGWVPMAHLPVQQALESQAQNVKDEFQQRYNFTVSQLAEQGLNACVFYENKDVRSFINMVPTSAISGDGMMDLLFLLTTLPSRMLVDKIMYHENLECTVLEVKAIEGLGTTMDVIVVNGRLKEKDTIVVCGLDGPIVTQIRSLLTPQPMKEMRVKTPYVHHKEICGAIGVKICANGIERALAGSNLMVLGEDDDENELRDEVMKDLGGILKKVKKNEDGVYVQASTLGSLEALLEFLEHPGEDRDGRPNKSIPVSGIGIGPVSKYDVMRCGVMLEREKEWIKMCEKEHAATGDWISGNPLNSIKEAYACILAFDVPVLPDAERLAKETGIVIYTAEIIYHLFDKFMKRVAEIKAKKKEEARKKAVYPCVFKIVDERCIFNKKDPYILGIDVLEGTLKLGTPVVIPNKAWTGDAKTQEVSTDTIEFGQVMSIEKDKKPVESATRLTGNVAIRIEQRRNMKEYTLGRHWNHESMFISRLNRESIDLLKEHFRDDLPKDDWKLIVKIKKVLGIP